MKNKLIKLKKQEDRTLWLSFGIYTCICMYISAVADSVMLYLQQHFCNISFKIKHYSLSVRPPQTKIPGCARECDHSSPLRLGIINGWLDTFMSWLLSWKNWDDKISDLCLKNEGSRFLWNSSMSSRSKRGRKYMNYSGDLTSTLCSGRICSHCAKQPPTCSRLFSTLHCCQKTYQT
jgi:hypothetical protein